jgi:hypothetical protein
MRSFATLTGSSADEPFLTGITANEAAFVPVGRVRSTCLETSCNAAWRAPRPSSSATASLPTMPMNSPTAPGRFWRSPRWTAWVRADVRMVRLRAGLGLGFGLEGRWVEVAWVGSPWGPRDVGAWRTMKFPAFLSTLLSAWMRTFCPEFGAGFDRWGLRGLRGALSGASAGTSYPPMPAMLWRPDFARLGARLRPRDFTRPG